MDAIDSKNEFRRCFHIGDRQLVFVTGKGGIGKSLIASSLALKASHCGLKVLLVEQAATDHLGAILGVTGVGHEPVPVNENLDVANFTTGGNFRDFVVKHLKRGSLFETLAANKAVHSFFSSIPGFGELMLLGRLYYILNLAPVKPDLLIVDSFASGHFLSLMTTPQAVLESGLAGPIANETLNVKNFLADSSRTGVLLVGVPEDLVVSEMIDFIPKIRLKSPVELFAVVFNRSLLPSAGIQNSAFASDFLVDRQRLQVAAMEGWRLNPIRNQFKNLACYAVPDLGFIDEPVSLHQVDRLLVASSEEFK